MKVFSLLLLVSVFLAACGGGGKKTEAPKDQGTAKQEASKPPTERVLVIAVPSDMQNLDPTLSGGDVTTQEVLTNIYGFLISFKTEKAPNGEQIGNPDAFVGDLAESYAVSPDGKKVTFKLRPGLKFSNGDPINANAVKFTYDRIFGQNAITAFLTKMAAVDGADAVKVIDDLTVEFAISKPNTLLFGNMAQFGHAILNPNVVKPHMTKDDPWAHEWLKANAKGTESGPYVIDKWEPGNQIVLKKNPNYHRAAEIKNDKVVLKIIPDPSSRLAQLKAGAVDIAYDIPTKDLAALEKDSNVKVVRNTTRAVGYLGMNNEVEPFNNVKVRQAISYAIPYDTIREKVLNGYGIQLTSPIPKGTPFHTDEFFKYKRDVEKAKQLLKEAGHPNGFKTKFTIPNDKAEAKETAVWVQSSLKEIGIEVEIEQMPGAAFTEKMQKRNHVFFYANQWISINNDPFYHIFWLLKSDCCDYARYKNDKVWEAIDKYTLNPDQNARAAAAKEIQKIVVEDAPWIFLFQPDHIIVTRKDVKGYTWFSADRYNRYQFLSKEGW